MKQNKESTDKIVNLLTKTIYSETAKPFEKVDYDLVNECNNFLCLLNDNKSLSDIEVKRIMAKIEKRNHAPVFSRRLKKYIAASIIVVLIGCFSIIGYSFNYDIKYLIDNIYTQNSSLTDKNDIATKSIIHSFRRNTETYETMEDIIENTETLFHYPSVLPNDLWITTVIQDDEEKTVLRFNSRDEYIIIEHDTQKNEEDINKDTEKVIVNNFTFYTKNANKRYYAHAIIDGDYYFIFFKTKEHLSQILAYFK